MRDKINEIMTLLKAKDPLIYVNTYEENEFLVDLCNAVSLLIQNTNGKTGVPSRIFVYSKPIGLRTVNLSDPLTVQSETIVKDVNGVNDALNYVMSIQNGIPTDEPKDIMDSILKHNSPTSINSNPIVGNAIFVFKDLHPYLTDKDVNRFIRDLKERYYSPNIGYCPIIVTSPVVEIPTELEKIFTYFEYPLMGKNEIEKYLVQFINKKSYTDEEFNSIVSSCCGMTSREILRAVFHSLAGSKMSKINSQDIYQEKIQLVKKSGCLDYIEPKYNIEDLGGCDKFKNWIKQVKESITPEAKAFGIPSPKGAMLVGVPGTSKSASAEIMASYLNIPLLSLQMSKIMGSFVGQSERAISNALRIAKAISPCILLLDECEKQLGGIQSSNQSDSGTLSRVMANVLNFLQEDTGVIVMMTSNDISQLPPELTRSGRIDTQWIFDLPNKYERHDIIDIYLKKNNLKVSNALHEYIDNATENFTGAEIKTAVKNMLVEHYYNLKKRANSDFNNRELEFQDVTTAIKNTVTVWKSSKEKIQNFRTFANGRYLPASSTENELREKEDKNNSIKTMNPFDDIQAKTDISNNVFTLL